MNRGVALGIVARAPSDERGKTRLVRALGVRDGAGLRRAILLDTLDAAFRVRRSDVVVVFTPAGAAAEFAALAPGAAHRLPQRGATLGHRLEQAFHDLFGLGYSGVALVGSDLPTLPVRYLDDALNALMQQPDPLVLGPAEDGGYYLIGLRRPHPELFQAVPWSTPAVLQTTLDIATAHRLPVTLLPRWYDVDSTADLDRAMNDEAANPWPTGGGRHIRAWADLRLPPRS